MARRVSVDLPTLVRELFQSGLMPESAGSYAKRQELVSRDIA